jgi:hypothetical protein
MRRALGRAGLVVGALALASCGGDDEATSTSTTAAAEEDVCSLLGQREKLYDRLHDEVSDGPLHRLASLPEGAALDEAALAENLAELDRIEAEVLTPLLDVYDRILAVAEPQYRGDLGALRDYDIGYLEHYRQMRTEDDLFDIRPVPSVSDTVAALVRLKPLLEGDCGLD